MALNSLDVLYDIAIKRADAQIEQIEAIEEKLRNKLQFATLVIAIPVTFLTIRPTQITLPMATPFILALVLYVSIVVITALAHRFEKIPYLASVRDLRNNLVDRDAVDTKTVILDILIDNIEAVGGKIRRKIAMARWAFVLFYPELALVVIFIALAVIRSTFPSKPLALSIWW